MDKGYVVIEHSDGNIIGCHIFVGKNDRNALNAVSLSWLLRT